MALLRVGAGFRIWDVGFRVYRVQGLQWMEGILHPLVFPVITAVASTQDGARPRSSTIILLLILYPGFRVPRAMQQAYYETQLLSISTAIGSHRNP